MKAAFLIAILAITTPAFANPYLVSDPSPDTVVDSCEISGLSLPCTLDAARAIKVDLASLAAGTYTVTAKFCTQGGVWCSADSSPFVFTKPGALVRPVNIKLTK